MYKPRKCERCNRDLKKYTHSKICDYCWFEDFKELSLHLSEVAAIVGLGIALKGIRNG